MTINCSLCEVGAELKVQFVIEHIVKIAQLDGVTPLDEINT